MNCDDIFEILTEGPFPRGTASDALVEMHLLECPSCQRLAQALQPALELLHESLSGPESNELPEYWGSLFLEEVCQAAPVDEPSSEPGSDQGREARFTYSPASRSDIWAIPAQSPEAARPHPLLTSAGMPAEAAPSTLPSVAMPAKRASANEINAAPTPRSRWLWYSLVGSIAAAVLVAITWVPSPWVEPPHRPTPSPALTAGVPAPWNQFGVTMACFDAASALPSIPAAPQSASTTVPSSTTATASTAASASPVPHRMATATARGMACCTQCHAAGKPATAKQPSIAMLTQSCLVCHVAMP